MQVKKDTLIKFVFIVFNALLFSSFFSFGPNILFGIKIYKILDFIYFVSLSIIMIFLIIIFFKKFKLSLKTLLYFTILNFLLFIKYFHDFKLIAYTKDILIFNSIILIIYCSKYIGKINFRDLDKNIDILNIFLLIVVPVYFIMNSDYYNSILYHFNIPNFYQEYIYYNKIYPYVSLSNGLNWIIFIYFILNLIGYLNTKKNKYYYYIFLTVFFILISQNLYIKIIFILFNILLLLYYFDTLIKLNMYLFKFIFLILFLFSFSFIIIPYEKFYSESNVYKTILSKKDLDTFDFDKSLLIKNHFSEEYRPNKFNNFECKYLKICFNNKNSYYFDFKSLIERLEMQRIIKEKLLQNKIDLFFGNHNLSKYQTSKKVYTHNSYLNLIFGQGILISILFIFIFQNLIKDLNFEHLFQRHIIIFLLLLPLLDDYLFRNRVEVTIIYWIFISILARKDFLYET